jgi:hypothetical protein
MADGENDNGGGSGDGGNGVVVQPAAQQGGVVNWKPNQGDEPRRIDDAQALIPYIFGAFRHPSRNGYRPGLPVMEYITPVIDMKTGEWTFHALEPLHMIKKIMQVSGKSFVDLLCKVTRKVGGQEAQVTSFSLILRRIDEIEDSIMKIL